MSVFKEEPETKRVIFNVRLDLARRLETAKEESRGLGKKLDVDGAIDKALEKFLKKAEKKISEMKRRRTPDSGSSDGSPPSPAPDSDRSTDGDVPSGETSPPLQPKEERSNEAK
jgi:hypothetical protein